MLRPFLFRSRPFRRRSLRDLMPYVVDNFLYHRARRTDRIHTHLLQPFEVVPWKDTADESQGKPLSLVLPRDGDHQSEVGHDEALAGGFRLADLLASLGDRLLRAQTS